MCIQYNDCLTSSLFFSSSFWKLTGYEKKRTSRTCTLMACLYSTLPAPPPYLNCTCTGIHFIPFSLFLPHISHTHTCTVALTHTHMYSSTHTHIHVCTCTVALTHTHICTCTAHSWTIRWWGFGL